jgi:hypothetical protein
VACFPRRDLGLLRGAGGCCWFGWRFAAVVVGTAGCLSEWRLCFGLALVASRVLALRWGFSVAIGGLGVLEDGSQLFCVLELCFAGAGQAFQAGERLGRGCVVGGEGVWLLRCFGVVSLVVRAATAVLGARFLVAVVLASRPSGLGLTGPGSTVVFDPLPLVFARVLGLGLAGLLRFRAAVAGLSGIGCVIGFFGQLGADVGLVGLWILLGARPGFDRAVPEGLLLVAGRVGR